MFGILRPDLRQLAKPQRRDYQAAYCNLCASLSHRYGIASRFLVVYDFVSLAWLLGEIEQQEYPYPRYNCLKGGTLLHKARKQLRPVDEFLAAISAYTCGVKVRDDIADNDRRFSKLTHTVHRKTFDQCRIDLVDDGFDIEAMDAILAEQARVEQRQECCLEAASTPTGQAYALVAERLVELQTGKLSAELAAEVGEQLGRTIFLIDAYRDFYKDANRNYNPLFDPARMTATDLPHWRRRELVDYIFERMQRIETTVTLISPEATFKWNVLKHRLLTLLGIARKSVCLNVSCCIPCGDGFCICDGADADECCTTACFGCCCFTCLCSYCGCC